MKPKQGRLVAIIAVLAFRLAACGGGTPSGPSADGVTLEGTVVGSGFASSSVRAAAAALTVMVAESPAMPTTIGADGRFTLRGLPEGAFTLVFLSDGAEIGRIAFDAVQPNQALTVTVSIAGSSVTLLEERRNGIGHGDLEIEGRIEQVIVLDPAGDSRFLIDGKVVIARPGQTAIRDGNRAKVAAELLAGQRVHVKGVWLDVSGTRGAAQEVLAWEIKMQGDVPTTGPSPSPVPSSSPSPSASCMINGGRVGDGIELEGSVAAGALPVFTMTVNGNRASGPVAVQAGSATVRCNGPSTTPAQCQARVTAGARIHVSGTLTTCTNAAATVTASEVKVQN